MVWVSMAGQLHPNLSSPNTRQASKHFWQYSATSVTLDVPRILIMRELALIMFSFRASLPPLGNLKPIAVSKTVPCSLYHFLGLFCSGVRKVLPDF